MYMYSVAVYVVCQCVTVEYDVPPSCHLSLTFAVYSDVRGPGFKEREGAVTVVQRGEITISKYQFMGLCKYISKDGIRK